MAYDYLKTLYNSAKKDSSQLAVFYWFKNSASMTISYGNLVIAVITSVFVEMIHLSYNNRMTILVIVMIIIVFTIFTHVLIT